MPSLPNTLAGYGSQYNVTATTTETSSCVATSDVTATADVTATCTSTADVTATCTTTADVTANASLYIKNLDCSTVATDILACDSMTIAGEDIRIDIDALQVRMTEAESDITSLTTRMNTAESDIDTLTTDLGTLSTSVSTSVPYLQGQITTNTTNISGLNTRLTSAEGTITTLSNNTQYQTASGGLTSLSGGLNIGASLGVTGTAIFSSPYSTTYNGTAPTSDQIGYTFSTAASTTAAVTNTNLQTVSITKGVWLVEGSFQVSLSTATSWIFWSLSTTSATHDLTRCHTSVATVAVTASRKLITTVFAVDATTTIYAVGTRSGTSSNDSTLIRITRIA